MKKETVLIEEEFGFRYWYWYTNMTRKELIKFWKSIFTIDKFNFYSILSKRGKLKEVITEIEFDRWEHDYEMNKYHFSSIFDGCTTHLYLRNPRLVIEHRNYTKEVNEFNKEIETFKTKYPPFQFQYQDYYATIQKETINS